MSLEEQLREMKLHDELRFSNLTVLKVLGGWIYTQQYKTFGEGVGTRWLTTSVFVPEP